MCKNCKFWIGQNEMLIKINADLGERNRALEKVCDEIDHGEIVRVLGKLNPTQLNAVKAFARYIMDEDELQKRSGKQ